MEQSNINQLIEIFFSIEDIQDKYKREQAENDINALESLARDLLHIDNNNDYDSETIIGVYIDLADMVYMDIDCPDTLFHIYVYGDGFKIEILGRGTKSKIVFAKDARLIYDLVQDI